MLKDHQIDIDLTRRALELAADGIGLVSPNPLVGCVITSKDGTIVGEGTYTRQGVIHAEAIALERPVELRMFPWNRMIIMVRPLRAPKP